MRRSSLFSSTVLLTSRLVRSFSQQPHNYGLVETAFIGGLVGDALALGGHYEYDAGKIKARVGRYTDFKSPGEGMGGTTHGVGWGTANYHPGKKSGDLTDAGEVAIMLLEYLVSHREYSFDGYATYWKTQIDEGYGSCNFQTVPQGTKDCPNGLKPGYLNGATRRTLQALMQMPHAKGEQRKALAADVNCLVAATHFLPLFAVESDEDTLVRHARSTVYLSHRNHDPVVAAEFLTRALHRIIFQGLGLREALREAAKRTNDAFISSKLAEAEAKVLEATDPASALSQEELVDDIALTSMARLWDVGKSEPIKVGKASPTEGALPGALYFALKYEGSLEEALIANAGVGGDSAVRGMVIGMLLGAARGADGGQAIPQRWLDTLRSLPHVRDLFQQLRSPSRSTVSEL